MPPEDIATATSWSERVLISAEHSLTEALVVQVGDNIFPACSRCNKRLRHYNGWLTCQPCCLDYVDISRNTVKIEMIYIGHMNEKYSDEILSSIKEYICLWTGWREKDIEISAEL